MASRFWVGGGSSTNWSATGNTNWAATSGGANNQSVPGSTDIAIFDSNSGTGTSVIDANITIQGLECDGSTLGTGAYGGTLTHNSPVTVTLNTGAANTLRLASGMTYTAVGAISTFTLTHTSGTANVKTYGKRLSRLTINGTGGTTTLLDDLRVDAMAPSASSILTITSGTFDAGGFNVTANSWVNANSANRITTLGSGLMKVGGGSDVTVWDMNITGTFNKNTANIQVLAAGSATDQIFNSGAKTYNDLTLNSLASRSSLRLTGAATYANLNVAAGWSVGIPAATTVTVSNAFTWTGTSSLPITLTCGTYPQAGTLSVSSGTCSITWGILLGTTGSGGATFSATNSLQGYLVTGWTVTPPSSGSAGASRARIQSGF